MASPATHRSEAGTAAAMCGGCHLARHCAAAPEGVHGPFRGGPLVVAAVAYFLAPAGLALVGAILAGGDAPRQLLGGAAGLFVGMLSAVLGARRYTALQGAGEDCFEPR